MTLIPHKLRAAARLLALLLLGATGAAPAHADPTTYRLKLTGDSGTAGLTDAVTGSRMTLPAGDAVVLEMAAFTRDGAALAPELDPESVTVEVYASPESTELVMEPVSTADYNEALTLEQWTAGTDQHASVTIPGTSTNIVTAARTRTVWVVIYAVLDADHGGARRTLGTGYLTLNRTGAGGPGPEEPGPQYPTNAQMTAYLAEQNAITASLAAKNPVINIRDVYAEGSNTWESAIETAYARCITAGGGSVFIPNGVYLLTGPYRATHSQGVPHYAQIVLPAVGQTEGADAVRIVGESPPSLTTNEYTGLIPNPETGVILQGARPPPDTGGYQYSLIGSQAVMSGGFGPWNWRQVDLENLTFRVQSIVDGDHVAINMCGIDFSRVAMARLKNVRVDVQSIAGQQLSPMGGQSVGVRMGDTTNWIIQECEDVLIRGFRRGIDVAEHFRANRLVVTGCGWGIRTQGGHHPIYLENCGLQWCITPLLLSGTSAIVGDVQIEGYAATDRWYTQGTYDISGENTSAPLGEIRYARGMSGGGYRVLAVAPTVDTGRLRLRNMRDIHGAEYWNITDVNLTLNAQHPLKPVRLANGSAGAITVPHLSVGSQVEIYNAGAGIKTLTPVDGDLHLTAAAGKLAIPQGERRILRWVAQIGAATYVDVIP